MAVAGVMTHILAAVLFGPIWHDLGTGIDSKSSSDLTSSLPWLIGDLSSTLRLLPMNRVKVRPLAVLKVP